MDTHRTTHLARLAELREEAMRLSNLAELARHSSNEAYRRETEAACDAAWGSYHELRAGTQ
jgi:hypothetical protein